jgi:hypothetical protein
MPSLLNAFLVATALCGQAQEPADDTDPKARQQHMKERAAELSLARDPAGGAASRTEPPRLTAEPVLRYSNAERDIGSLDGITFLFVEGERPVAAVSLSVRRNGFQVYHELTSLVKEPLVCRRGEAAVWSPKTGGLLAQAITDGPPPADGKPQRLTQMRALSRRFTATCFNARSEEPSELRLLTQPLYRYTDPAKGIVDGALFAFVVSNDPELFLVLEAVKAKDAEPRWQYSLARMSSLKMTIRLDEREVWTVPNFYRDPQEDRKTGPYTEARIGTFAPNPAPPE